jgi:four helix bundle protein
MDDIKIEQIKSFTELPAWQEGHQLVLIIFRAVKNFPADEALGFTNQIKRSALGITSNIVEGFGRKVFKEKVQFYTFALKSVREIQNYILIARDLGYLDRASFDKIAEQSSVVIKLCATLVKGGKR